MTRKLKLSLNTMQDMFRVDTNIFNARKYRDLALEYWEDEIINDSALITILKEIRDSPA